MPVGESGPGDGICVGSGVAFVGPEVMVIVTKVVGIDVGSCVGDKVETEEEGGGKGMKVSITLVDVGNGCNSSWKVVVGGRGLMGSVDTDSSGHSMSAKVACALVYSATAQSYSCLGNSVFGSTGTKLRATNHSKTYDSPAVINTTSVLVRDGKRLVSVIKSRIPSPLLSINVMTLVTRVCRLAIWTLWNELIAKQPLLPRVLEVVGWM